MSTLRVTEDSIRAKIKTCEFFNLPGTTVTICHLTLENGFSVRGEDSCVDPKNFNQELGNKYSYEDAFNQIWKLEGYLLKQRMYEAQLIEESENATKQ